MPTTAERNAVYDAIKKDVDELVNDLVPFFYRSTVMTQITTARILKIVDDAIAADAKVKS
jgi:hypothetical protein